MFGDPASQGETEARSALFLMLRVLSAIETIEDARQILFGYADAVIQHGHDHAILVDFALQPDPTSRGSIAAGIVDQDAKHALDQVRVGKNPKLLRGLFMLKIEGQAFMRTGPRSTGDSLVWTAPAS